MHIILSLLVLHNNTPFVKLRFKTAPPPAAIELEEPKAAETTSFDGPTACMSQIIVGMYSRLSERLYSDGLLFDKQALASIRVPLRERSER